MTARSSPNTATEGATTAVEFACDRFNLPHLASVIHPANRVAEKLDITRERVVTLNGTHIVLYGRDRELGTHCG
jgi:hypothetical protein